jgi:hypothetical protein
LLDDWEADVIAGRMPDFSAADAPAPGKSKGKRLSTK